jgi:small-conductance mechanosensitive channel
MKVSIKALFCLFLVVFPLWVKAQDSLSTTRFQKELELLKKLREKDSLRIDMLTNELKMLLSIRLQEQQNKPLEDSVYQTQIKEIQLLREQTSGVPVVFYNDTIFSIYTSLGPYLPEERKQNIEGKLVKLYKKPFFFQDSIVLKNANGFINISYQNEIINGVSASDALWAGVSLDSLAKFQATTIKQAILKQREAHSLKNNLIRIGELLLIITFLIVIVWGINRIFRYLKTKLTDENRFLSKGIKIRNYEVIRRKQLQKMLSRFLSVLKLAIIIILIFSAIPLIFSLFPFTENWAEEIRKWFWEPVRKIGLSAEEYLPKLVTIIIILFIARYILRLFRYFALEVERGNLVIKNFHKEWAQPTYSLIRFVFLILVVIIIFPYLPGSGSDVFKGVSVFLGILISIGSSSAVANAVAGLVITYMRPFQVNDWIKTGDITGIVIEKNALVTRLKTINNEDVSVPNSAVLNGHTINYSSIGKTDGLVLTSKIKVRYDYPHNLVEELLIEAALKTKDISETPHPYVFQLSLEEINVVYELNAFTFVPENMYFIKSDLIKNIQNVFTQAKVEIASTQYIEIKGSHSTK